MTDRRVFTVIAVLLLGGWWWMGMPGPSDIPRLPIPVPGELCRDIPAVADIDLSPWPMEIECGGDDE